MNEWRSRWSFYTHFYDALKVRIGHCKNSTIIGGWKSIFTFQSSLRVRRMEDLVLTLVPRSFLLFNNYIKEICT